MSHVLLVSKSDKFASKMRRIKECLFNLSLSIAETFIEAHQRLQQENVQVVLIHAVGEMQDGEILEFLQTLVQNKWRGSSLILADFYKDQQMLNLLRAGAV